MKKGTRYFLIGFLSILTTTAYSQKKDFGDVSRSILEMEVYEKDSTADAVVIFDVAEAYIDEELSVKMKRHVRIKILTDNGLDQGEITLPFRHEEPEQRIRKLKAHSLEIDDKGKVKKHKLGRRDKFENKVSDNWSELKFVVPNLSKGSVFEYEYEWESDLVTDLPDWYFQRNIPVMWSEYTAAIPEWFIFLVYKRTYHDFKVDAVKKYNDSAIFHSSQFRSGFVQTNQTRYSGQQTSRIDYNGNEYNWVMTDLPAIKDEPYMKAKIDYYAQVQLQLARVQFPNSHAENVLRSWPSLVDALAEDDDYGKKLKSSSFLKGIVEKITANDSSYTEKMISVYDHVREVMDWNDNYGLFLNENLEEIYKSGSGSGSEINLLLTQLLREAGLEAHPVVISTRNHGEIIDMYPLANQFNHSIVKVNSGNGVYLLDAKNEHRPYNVLPVNNLNGNGLVVEQNNIEWLPIVNRYQNKSTDLINITIDTDGTLDGVFQSSNEGMFSYYKDVDIFKNDDPVNENAKNYLFTDSESIKVDSVYSVDHKLTKGALDFSVKFSIENEDNDPSTIYLKPVLFDDVSDKSFDLKERTFPVDFNFPFYKTTILNYILPSGWEVDEHPESKQYNLGDGGTYRRIIQVNGNIVTIRDDFLIAKPRFMPEEYKYLKELFNGVSVDNENFIVIKKTQP